MCSVRLPAADTGTATIDLTIASDSVDDNSIQSIPFISVLPIESPFLSLSAPRSLPPFKVIKPPFAAATTVPLFSLPFSSCGLGAFTDFNAPVFSSTMTVSPLVSYTLPAPPNSPRPNSPPSGCSSPTHFELPNFEPINNAVFTWGSHSADSFIKLLTLRLCNGEIIALPFHMAKLEKSSPQSYPGSTVLSVLLPV